jgi:hypothetical protein
MNDAAKELVDVLRAGTYAQGKFRLRTPGNKYCCLGVACDLYGQGSWQLGRFKDFYFFKVGAKTFIPNKLPNPVRKRLNFTYCGGDFTWWENPNPAQKELMAKIRNTIDRSFSINESGICSLYSLNDNGVPFDLIADVIEAEPPGLFMRGN